MKIYMKGEMPDFRGRDEAVGSEVEVKVIEIIRRVRDEGDGALREYAALFDGLDAETPFEVSPDEVEKAYAAADKDFISILELAKSNILAFHERQKRAGFVMDGGPGVMLGQRVIPLDRVGVYVPGGTASYPSTVLMDVLPARIAGVGEIIMTTPAKNDIISPDILAAAKVAGVDRVFRLGGAQAVAAMAYGTESLPRVDKIVGPGNAYVATAKRMVYGSVDIDMIAGPSEILILADKTANPSYLAADMLAQAEHDRLASAVLVTDCQELGGSVESELERQLESLPRRDIARASIESYGAIVIVDGFAQAVEAANRIAPEHLELCVEDPFALLPLIRRAGSVFLGGNAPEALGDYLAGPNHTLPTNGTARFSSPLSVDDFVRKSSFIYYGKDALREVADSVAAFARLEGLEAHARSVELRLLKDEKP